MAAQQTTQGGLSGIRSSELLTAILEENMQSVLLLALVLLASSIAQPPSSLPLVTTVYQDQLCSVPISGSAMVVNTCLNFQGYSIFVLSDGVNATIMAYPGAGCNGLSPKTIVYQMYSCQPQNGYYYLSTQAVTFSPVPTPQDAITLSSVDSICSDGGWTTASIVYGNGCLVAPCSPSASGYSKTICLPYTFPTLSVVQMESARLPACCQHHIDSEMSNDTHALSNNSHSKLFQPYKVGDVELQHRVIMAPLTRCRADDNHVHQDVAVEYYAQRAITPGTLIITEATFIAPEAGGIANVPGIWSDEQVAAWNKITDAVHEKSSFIYMQLWALGRVANPDILSKTGHKVVSASNIPASDKHVTPTALDKEGIQHFKSLYVQAAKNAIRAGFDGVEVHGANGYLIDQFLQTNSNDRTDEYGGSEENRTRFALEVMEAVAAEIGQEKTALRISPFSTFQGMGMSDPKPTFSHLTRQLIERVPRLSYLHVVEARIAGNADVTPHPGASCDFLYDIWSPRPFFIAGGFKVKDALQVVEEKEVAVVFGRYFISNPDLPLRIKYNIELEPYNRETFYVPGPQNKKGYTDYPYSPIVERYLQETKKK
ncbi:hypothetical protein PROFUN_07988 [Planoprotostelium fungivorum]|uniref:NADH:flavin oxidoreductase/NADH oxidase N-terminal domain-containing protein n=1 Tax=Planoprotostelium fungivorum TaxID=1890364 RepID=A0A2P6MV82_9EUKA|nr:hypothetical protein PROFUN_07988 [Planoprotostelium fungivorum]